VKTLISIGIIIALSTGAALAQRGGGRIGRGGGRGLARGGAIGDGLSPQQREDRAITLFNAFLSLDDAQKQQLKTIFDNAIQEAQSLQPKGDSSGIALFDAAKMQKSDEDLQKLADEQAAAAAQQLVLQARTLSKVMAILHDDQKLKVDQFLFNEIESLMPAPAGTPAR
jgi:Spy/CpxP family protein refolding chaperone